MSEEHQRFRATVVTSPHEAQAMIQPASPTIPTFSSTIWGTFTGSIINQKSQAPRHSLMAYWNSHAISLSDTAKCYQHTECEKMLSGMSVC